MIPEGWKAYNLGDVSKDISYGYTESASSDEVGPKFLRITDIQNYFIKWGEVPYCPITEANHKKYKLDKGDIVIARTGASTGVNSIIKNENVDAVYASYLIRYKINRQVADPSFVGFVLKSPLWINHINSIIGGSAQPGANAKQFASFKFILPPLEEQSRIASILSSLDAKIELNLQMNKTLEAIAQAIFKEWFVDFRFPGFDGQLVDGLPEGWKECKLGDIIDLKYGKALKSENRHSGEYLVVGSSGIVGFHSEYLVEAPGIVIGRKGTIGEVIWLDDNFYPIDTTFFVTDKIGLSELFFHYYLLLSQNFNKIGSDSAVPGLNRNQALMNPIICPDLETIRHFNTILKPLFEKKYLNNQEIQTLTQLRDALLPKLISGKIRVA